MKVEVRERRLRFARAVRTAFGTLEERHLVELTLTAPDGVVGCGEAAPLEPYDGVPLGAVADALDAFGPVLKDADASDVRGAVQACRAIRDLPQALAAVDLALWDMAGRRSGKPVASLLADAPAASVPVNATIGAVGPQDAAAAGTAAANAGFTTIKVKVGAEDDVARVQAVRSAVGPHIALRLDANGAWSVDEAVAAIDALMRFDPELVEEPVHGLEALRAVRDRVSVPIAMDETAADPDAVGSGATDAVCLKISSCGGIAGLLDRAAAVRAAGSEVYVASTFDGALGIAAGLHAAAALLPRLACGLATLDLFAESNPGRIAVAAGAMKLPTSPGLGCAD